MHITEDWGCEMNMKNLVAVAVVAVLAAQSFAGPFGLFSRKSYNNNSGNTTNNQTYYYDNSELYSAQGVANRMARLLRMQHLGNPTGGYEGVGMSAHSPQAAIQNCCYYGRRPLRDSGVAQGANGMWYACCRYN